MKECNVAVGQFAPLDADKKGNIEKIAMLAKDASQKSAHFLILPEYATTGADFEQCKKLAEEIPGPSCHELCTIAKKNKIYIAVSMMEKEATKEASVLYNTAILLSPDGILLGKYRKIHLFLDEKKYVSSGKGFALIDTAFGKVGLMVCYDTAFPEISRQLSLKGCEMIIVPANWPDPYSLQWQVATSARALDNQIWIVAVNRIGKDKTFSYFGKSRIISPLGECVGECGNSEEVLVAKISPTVAESFKSAVNFLADRVPDAYQ